MENNDSNLKEEILEETEIFFNDEDGEELPNAMLKAAFGPSFNSMLGESLTDYPKN